MENIIILEGVGTFYGVGEIDVFFCLQTLTSQLVH